MLERFGRKVYASVKNDIDAAIGKALLKHRHLIAADEETPDVDDVQDALDRNVGDALTDVISDVNETMPEIAAEMLTAQGDEDEDDEDAFELEEGDDDEPEPEPDEGDDAEELEAVAAELTQIKASMKKQAARLAKTGDIDSAARLKMLAKKL